MSSTISNSCRVGLAQISPVWLNRTETIRKIVSWVQKAADQSCQLVCFGETLLPGYPFWLDSTGGAAFNSTVQKEIFAHYIDQAVDIDRGDLAPLCNLAAKAKIMVVLGCFELGTDRGGHTGYCSAVTIGTDGTIQNVHRKLMPTYEERLVWGTGDGHGLNTMPLGSFTVGTLNCWENWMPLVRSALYAKGEDLRVALWPGSLKNTEDITRFIATEGRSYVLSVSGLMRKEDIPDDMPHAELVRQMAPDMMASGASCVAAPDGSWLVPPVDSSEQLVVADLDKQQVLMERQNFDPSGHYSRPDVTRLVVNQSRQSVLEIRNGKCPHSAD